MRCKALRGFYLSESLCKRGEFVDVPDALVRQLELIGKVERAPEPAHVESAPAKAHKPKPMTTESAPALVAGANTVKDKQDD